MSKEYGIGDHLEQVKVTKLESTTLMRISKHRTNGGTDTKDSQQLSSMISILTR